MVSLCQKKGIEGFLFCFIGSVIFFRKKRAINAEFFSLSPHHLSRSLTFSLRSWSPLHREFTDTLKDFQAGFKLFITT